MSVLAMSHNATAYQPSPNAYPPDTKYLLPYNSAEIGRLNRQHLWLCRFLNVENTPIPPIIDLNQVSNILDAAAGTLVWSLEVAQQAEVRKRLQDRSRPIRIYACDLTSEKFPPRSITDSLCIETFLHDITKPFPEHMLGTFDIINMKLLVLALTNRGWSKALSNAYKLLRRGGKLILREADSFFYTNSDRLVNNRTTILNRTREERSWVYPLNHIFKMNAKINHHFDDLAEQLPKLVESSGFRVLHSISGMLPMGVACKHEPNVIGQSMASEEEFSTKTAAYIFDVVTKLALKEGYLQDRNDLDIVTEEGRKALCASILGNFYREGCFISVSELVVERV